MSAVSQRSIAIVFCLVTVMMCLAYAGFRQSLPAWWREHGGGIPYVMFWIAFAYAWFPQRRHLMMISVLAVLGTCLLEFLQLWQPAWLTSFRGTRFGAALLGNQFSWQDFPPYFYGGLLSYLVLHWTKNDVPASN